jgi:hypothetical protein
MKRSPNSSSKGRNPGNRAGVFLGVRWALVGRSADDHPCRRVHRGVRLGWPGPAGDQNRCAPVKRHRAWHAVEWVPFAGDHHPRQAGRRGPNPPLLSIDNTRRARHPHQRVVRMLICCEYLDGHSDWCCSQSTAASGFGCGLVGADEPTSDRIRPDCAETVLPRRSPEIIGGAWAEKR